jgi:hypothetical protein
MESLNLLGFTFGLALEVHQDIREEKEEDPSNQKCIQRFPYEIQKDQSDRDGNIDQYGPSFFWHLFTHWKLQSVLRAQALPAAWRVKPRSPKPKALPTIPD